MATVATSSLAVILLITEETDRTATFYRQVLGLRLEGQQHDDSHQHDDQVEPTHPDLPLSAIGRAGPRRGSTA